MKLPVVTLLSILGLVNSSKEHRLHAARDSSRVLKTDNVGGGGGGGGGGGAPFPPPPQNIGSCNLTQAWFRWSDFEDSFDEGPISTNQIPVYQPVTGELLAMMQYSEINLIDVPNECTSKYLMPVQTSMHPKTENCTLT